MYVLNQAVSYKLSHGHSLSAMQLVQSLQFPHILLQARVLIEIIQHVTTQSLKGKVNVHISHINSSSHLSVNFHGTLRFPPS